MENIIETKLTDFFQKFRFITFKKGEIIFRPGDLFQHVSFVKSGYVRLYVIDKEGKEHTIGSFKPIFCLSLMYALNGLENKYYFEAITPVELWSAPKEDFFEFVKHDNETSYFLNTLLLKVVDELLNNVEQATRGDSYEKIANLLASLAQNYGVVENGKTRIDFTTTHNLIASLTGVTRETASIQMKKMENEGLLQKEGQYLVINDLAKLKSLS